MRWITSFNGSVPAVRCQANPRQLVESVSWFFPGPLSGDLFNELTAAYDEMMAGATGPNFKIGSTTTHTSDLLAHAAVFDDVFLYSTLLEACGHIHRRALQAQFIFGQNTQRTNVRTRNARGLSIVYYT